MDLKPSFGYCSRCFCCWPWTFRSVSFRCWYAVLTISLVLWSGKIPTTKTHIKTWSHDHLVERRALCRLSGLACLVCLSLLVRVCHGGVQRGCCDGKENLPTAVPSADFRICRGSTRASESKASFRLSWRWLHRSLCMVHQETVVLQVGAMRTFIGRSFTSKHDGCFLFFYILCIVFRIWEVFMSEASGSILSKKASTLQFVCFCLLSGCAAEGLGSRGGSWFRYLSRAWASRRYYEAPSVELSFREGLRMPRSKLPQCPVSSTFHLLPGALAARSWRISSPRSSREQRRCGGPAFGKHSAEC